MNIFRKENKRIIKNAIKVNFRRRYMSYVSI